MAGFAPTALLLILGWIYMATTGLLIAEVNINTLCYLDDRDAVSIPSMVSESLGENAASSASIAFVFLHNALLCAYTLQGGSLLGKVAYAWGSASPSGEVPLFSFGNELGDIIFATSLGLILVGLPPIVLERVNNGMVIGVIFAFLILVGFGLMQVQPTLLMHAQPSAIVDALPVMPVVYVFQTVVPTLCALLECEVERIRSAILVGTAIPLAMFLSWTYVILGTVPFDYEGSDPLDMLRNTGDGFGNVVLVFSLLAVATSFLGFTYGLIDFYADWFQWDNVMQQQTPRITTEGKEEENASREFLWRKWVLLPLAVAPPLAIAIFNANNPEFFFDALDNAGVYGILVLFGLLPPAMAWSQRYNTTNASSVASGGMKNSVGSALGGGEKAIEDDDGFVTLVPGGKTVLCSIGCIALLIIGLESWEKGRMLIS